MPPKDPIQTDLGIEMTQLLKTKKNDAISDAFGGLTKPPAHPTRASSSAVSEEAEKRICCFAAIAQRPSAREDRLVLALVLPRSGCPE